MKDVKRQKKKLEAVEDIKSEANSAEIEDQPSSEIGEPPDKGLL